MKDSGGRGARSAVLLKLTVFADNDRIFLQYKYKEKRRMFHV